MLQTRILPHEKKLLEGLIEQGHRENDQAAADMANAVSDVNVWHDNAEYDEVRDRMKLIDARYTAIAKLLLESELIDYPCFEDEKVNIGSLIETESDENIEWILIVGQIRTGDEPYKSTWDKEIDLKVITPASPLGNLLIGKKAGQGVELKIGKDSRSIKIISIDQNWINKFSTDINK